MENIIVTIISILGSGITATCITIWYQRKAAKKEAMQKIFTTAISCRYFIAQEENLKALNSIDVIFNKNEDVRAAWKKYLMNTKDEQASVIDIRDAYMNLLNKMASACGYKNIEWDDLTTFYSPIGVLEKIQDEEVLRKQQILHSKKLDAK